MLPEIGDRLGSVAAFDPCRQGRDAGSKLLKHTATANAVESIRKIQLKDPMRVWMGDRVVQCISNRVNDCFATHLHSNPHLQRSEGAKSVREGRARETFRSQSTENLTNSNGAVSPSLFRGGKQGGSAEVRDNLPWCSTGTEEIHCT